MNAQTAPRSMVRNSQMLGLIGELVDLNRRDQPHTCIVHRAMKCCDAAPVSI